MLYRKSVLAVLLGLIFLSFFGTLCASALMFPENYDWRYRVISNLLSPRDNLAIIGYRLAEWRLRRCSCCRSPDICSAIWKYPRHESRA